MSKKTTRADLIGQKFGRLTVVEDSGLKGYGNKPLWRCVCDCGGENSKNVLATTTQLRRGGKKSCNCLLYRNKKEDYVGKVFGSLTVIAEADPSDKGSRRLLCKCDCGNTQIVHQTQLTKGKDKCNNCMMNEKLLVKPGQTYGRLTVLREDIDNYKPKHRTWICQCNCEDKNIISVQSQYLLNGITQSCGCYHREIFLKIAKTRNPKNNTYIECDDYYICKMKNGEFKFDKRDYDLITQYTWTNNGKYSITTINGKVYPVHYILFGELWYDHINRDRYDNRRNNLRKCTPSENTRNTSLKCINTSGVTGVDLNSKTGKWQARITNNDHKRIRLYYGDSFEEAVKTRLEAEKKYYGEFAPQQHLYSKYGID